MPPIEETMRRPIAPSVQEVAHASENHGKVEPVRGGNHFVIAHGAARLNHGRCARLGSFFDAIRKRKKCVGSHHASPLCAKPKLIENIEE